MLAQILFCRQWLRIYAICYTCQNHSAKLVTKHIKASGIESTPAFTPERIPTAVHRGILVFLLFSFLKLVTLAAEAMSNCCHFPCSEGNNGVNRNHSLNHSSCKMLDESTDSIVSVMRPSVSPAAIEHDSHRDQAGTIQIAANTKSSSCAMYVQDLLNNEGTVLELSRKHWLAESFWERYDLGRLKNHPVPTTSAPSCRVSCPNSRSPSFHGPLQHGENQDWCLQRFCKHRDAAQLPHSPGSGRAHINCFASRPDESCSHSGATLDAHAGAHGNSGNIILSGSKESPPAATCRLGPLVQCAPQSLQNVSFNCSSGTQSVMKLCCNLAAVPLHEIPQNWPPKSKQFAQCCKFHSLQTDGRYNPQEHMLLPPIRDLINSCKKNPSSLSDFSRSHHMTAKRHNYPQHLTDPAEGTEVTGISRARSHVAASHCFQAKLSSESVGIAKRRNEIKQNALRELPCDPRITLHPVEMVKTIESRCESGAGRNGDSSLSLEVSSYGQELASSMESRRKHQLEVAGARIYQHFDAVSRSSSTCDKCGKAFRTKQGYMRHNQTVQ